MDGSYNLTITKIINLVVGTSSEGEVFMFCSVHVKGINHFVGWTGGMEMKWN